MLPTDVTFFVSSSGVVGCSVKLNSFGVSLREAPSSVISASRFSLLSISESPRSPAVEFIFELSSTFVLSIGGSPSSLISKSEMTPSVTSEAELKTSSLAARSSFVREPGVDDSLLGWKRDDFLRAFRFSAGVVGVVRLKSRMSTNFIWRKISAKYSNLLFRDNLLNGRSLFHSLGLFIAAVQKSVGVNIEAEVSWFLDSAR